MEMYKNASRQKLRFSTRFGDLATEQLWDLSVTDLDTLAVALENEYKESGKKSFLVKKSKKDSLLKLKFDLVVDVLTTKVDEEEASRERFEKKKFNEKIDALIAEKQEDEFKGLSVEELEKMRK